MTTKRSLREVYRNGANSNTSVAVSYEVPPYPFGPQSVEVTLVQGANGEQRPAAASVFGAAIGEIGLGDNVWFRPLDPARPNGQKGDRNGFVDNGIPRHGATRITRYLLTGHSVDLLSVASQIATTVVGSTELSVTVMDNPAHAAQEQAALVAAALAAQTPPSTQAA